MIKKEKVKHFDFAKHPKNPSFLMSVAKNVISFPDLKKRDFKLTKINMDNVTGPYLLLVTHSSMVDFNIMLKATHPHKVNNVMTLEGFNTYTEPLMRSLGVLGTRKLGILRLKFISVSLLKKQTMLFLTTVKLVLP